MSNQKTIYEKLLEIQKHVNGLGKDKQGNNYSYVTGSKVLEHIKPKMNELGLLLKQEVISIDNQRMDYKTGIGTQYEKPKSEILSKVMMRFTWVDTLTGEKDENLFGANGQNDWEKGLGSALTYAERYFLLKYFHINTDEDDIDNPERKPQQPIIEQSKAIDIPRLETRLRACTTVEELEKTYKSFTDAEQKASAKLTTELKLILINAKK
jgi:hypothetical protein